MTAILAGVKTFGARVFEIRAGKKREAVFHEVGPRNETTRVTEQGERGGAPSGILRFVYGPCGELGQKGGFCARTPGQQIVEDHALWVRAPWTGQRLREEVQDIGPRDARCLEQPAKITETCAWCWLPLGSTSSTARAE